MMEIVGFLEPARVPLPAASITPDFQLSPATSQPLQPCSFIPHSKQPLPFHSSQPGPAVTAQPAFLGSGFRGFPRRSRDGPAGMRAGTERQGCCRAGSQRKANTLPARGVPGVLRAARQPQISSTQRQGTEALLACRLCSLGSGDLLLFPGGVCHNRHFLWRKQGKGIK